MLRDDPGPLSGELHYSSVTKVILKTQDIEFYQIIYPDHTEFLFKQETGFLLVNPDGSITKEERACKLGRKIVSYERIMGKDIACLVMDTFLHIDEVEYILSEFLRSEDELYQLNYPRLRTGLDRQIASGKQRSLDLFSIAYHYEYIYDSLFINLGPPEHTENYYHKLNRTINRLIENLEFIRSEADPIRVLIMLISNLLRTVSSVAGEIVVVAGYGEYLVLRNHEASGIDRLIIPEGQLDLNRQDLVVVELTKKLMKQIIEDSDTVIRSIVE